MKLILEKVIREGRNVTAQEDLRNLPPNPQTARLPALLPFSVGGVKFCPHYRTPRVSSTFRRMFLKYFYTSISAQVLFASSEF